MSNAAVDLHKLTSRKPRVLNHDILNCTHSSILGNHLYSGRALGMSNPEDVIQLHPELRSEWPAIAAHYQRIGLPHSSDVIWDVDYQHLRNYSNHELSVFFFDEAINGNHSDGNWLGVVDYVNNKNNFMDLADELGMKVPTTLRFDNPAQLQDYDLAELPYPCYMKPAVSVSGAGIHRCKDADEVRSWLFSYDPDLPLQIQAEVSTELFLNVQYEVIDGTLHRLMVTEQVLDGFAHQGNRYPSVHAPWNSVGIMAQWMAANGMKGIFAFDVAVIKTPTGFDYLPIECNPRFNGASYPAAVALELGIPAWTAVQLSTSQRHLVHLGLEGLEYDPDSKTGVIIVNWGTVLAGKVGFLLAGSPEQQQHLLLTLKQRL